MQGTFIDWNPVSRELFYDIWRPNTTFTLYWAPQFQEFAYPYIGVFMMALLGYGNWLADYTSCVSDFEI